MILVIGTGRFQLTFQPNLQMHINGKSHIKCIHEFSWIGAIEIHWIETFTGWNDGAGMQESINLGRRYPAPYSMFYLSLLGKIFGWRN